MASLLARRYWAGVSLFVGLWLASVVAATSTRAWDRGGHYLVGAIAWEQMSESTRRSAVSLMLQAPQDSDLPALFSPGPGGLELRSREFFIRACYWADLVKAQSDPDRQAVYDEFDWHFVDWFWTSTAGEPQYLPERGHYGELLHQLDRLQMSVMDSKRATSARGLDTAWILHLVGDVHQPLHSSARITVDEPDGDRGGNDFPLSDVRADNLHAYWDSILTRSYPRAEGESVEQWVGATAAILMQSHPQSSLAVDLKDQHSFRQWSWDGVQFAMRSLFPKQLISGGVPSASYESFARRSSERLVVLAGYRLAATLNDRFDDRRWR